VRFGLSPSPLQVWAVEDTSVQVTWGHLPPGPVTAWSRHVHATVEHGGGPGSLDLSGLEPNSAQRIDVSWPGGRGQLEASTLPAPPGQQLCRVATISDLHLGARRWGASKLMVDRSGEVTPFPLRCARAAIAEAVAWGAEVLIVKGDAAHRQHSDDFAQVGQLLDGFDELPVLLIPGNHDVDGRGDCELPAKVGQRGIPYVRGAACEDLNAIRIIVADTTVAGAGPGAIEPVASDICELAAASPRPFLLGIHHQLQPFRFPTHYPAGIAAPASTAFLDQLASANPNGLVTSGHTHRNRARFHRSLPLTEVASTRDWPGVWAGYAVHEGGIRQVIRRTVAPEAISWHEYSRRALLGRWEGWSAGRLGERCFTHRWPDFA
jgi:hypothetical protein